MVFSRGEISSRPRLSSLEPVGLIVSLRDAFVVADMPPPVSPSSVFGVGVEAGLGSNCRVRSSGVDIILGKRMPSKYCRTSSRAVALDASWRPSPRFGAKVMEHPALS